MRTKNWKRALKLIIAVAMMPVSLVPLRASADGAGEACKPKKECDKAVAEFKLVDNSAILTARQAPSRSTGAFEDSGTLQQGASANAAAACEAEQICRDEKKKCKKPSCSEDNCKELDKQITQMGVACVANRVGAADAGRTQAATGASGEGGNSNAMMTGLMGAALGAGLMMMMQKKDDDQQQQQMPQMPYLGALQANGSIDCSKPDALAYRDCNSFMENRCKTILDDPTCQQFSARYCGPTAGGGAPPAVQPLTPPGVVFGVDPATLYGAQSEGVGSPYCRGVSGWNFCKVGGRGSCPSCLQIQRNQSPACAQNPALCLAQNSLSEIEKAKVSCPTDPAFADPAFAAGGGSQVPGIIAAGGLPAVVLPQSVSTGSGSTVSTGGISTQSARAAPSNGEAMREGSTNGYSQAGYASANGSVSGGGVSTSLKAGVGREFASASGAAAGFQPSNMSGPASDVQGQFGPSLFSTSSQVIRQRCQAGRLNNCP